VVAIAKAREGRRAWPIQSVKAHGPFLHKSVVEEQTPTRPSPRMQMTHHEIKISSLPVLEIEGFFLKGKWKEICQEC